MNKNIATRGNSGWNKGNTGWGSAWNMDAGNSWRQGNSWR